MSRRKRYKEVKKQAFQGSASSRTKVSNIELDPKYPIPLDYGDHSWISQIGKNYVPFLAPKDDLGKLLLEAKLLSPTNLACVSTKAEYCLGMGVGFDKENVEKEEEFKEWSRCVNNKGESLNEIIKGGFDSFFTCGNAYLQVSRIVIGGKKYVRVQKRNFLDCRLSNPGEDGVCRNVYVSKEFRNKGWDFKKDNMIEIPIWSRNSLDRSWVKDKYGAEHTMFHIKNSIEGYDDYGLPSNIGSLPHQILEYKGARYNLDNFSNNLVIGGVIVLEGQVSDDEAQKIAKNIIYQHTGDGKRGRYVVISSESGSLSGAKVIPHEKQTDASFLEMDTKIEGKIISANQWDAILAGIHHNSGVNNTINSAYIRSVFDIKNTVVIKPVQALMVEKFLEPLMEICNDYMGKKWEGVKMRTVMPISFLGDIDVNSIVMINEGREIAGLPVVEEEVGKKFIKDVRNNEHRETNADNSR